MPIYFIIYILISLEKIMNMWYLNQVLIKYLLIFKLQSLLIHFFHLSKSLYYSLFPKLLGFICKVFLEMHFYFAYGLSWREFFNKGKSNTPIEQDLASIEDEIECLNQTVTVFLLQPMQNAVLHCRDGLVASILGCFSAMASFNLSK